MINANVNEFIDHTLYEECAVMFHNKKYFFYGLLFHEENKTYSYDVALWDKAGNHVKWIFQETSPRSEELLERFYNKPIWDGKTFFSAEPEMEWIEW